MAKRQRSDSSSTSSTDEFFLYDAFNRSPYLTRHLIRQPRNSWEEEYEDVLPRIMAFQREVYIRRRPSEEEIEVMVTKKKTMENTVEDEREIIRRVLRHRVPAFSSFKFKKDYKMFNRTFYPMVDMPCLKKAMMISSVLTPDLTGIFFHFLFRFFLHEEVKLLEDVVKIRSHFEHYGNISSMRSCIPKFRSFNYSIEEEYFIESVENFMFEKPTFDLNKICFV